MTATRPPFVPAVDPPEAADQPAWWFVFHGTDLLVAENDDGTAVVSCLPDLTDLGLTGVRRQFLGRFGAAPCWSVELAAGAAAPPGMVFQGLRGLYGRLADDLYAVAGRASQIVAWDRDHQFCGRCGNPTEIASAERARRCPSCGLTAFPRLSPAIIVLIEKGDQILMARGRGFPERFFGIIAGFVEAGETLEEAVRREVREEVGLEIADVRYQGSQPWPFPHALMIGFTARYASGEIQIQESELADAGWFGVDDLPRIPSKLSIARRLVDAWAARHGRTLADE